MKTNQEIIEELFENFSCTSEHKIWLKAELLKALTLKDEQARQEKIELVESVPIDYISKRHDCKKYNCEGMGCQERDSGYTAHVQEVQAWKEKKLTQLQND